MFKPFKGFLTQKFVVGLELDNRFIRAVQIFNSSKGPEIDKIAFREINESDHMGEALIDFFHKENLKKEMLATSLPTSLAIIREISISFDNMKKLNEIIKYQMEPYVPDPIEDMVVDFLPPDKTGNIMTISVKKNNLSEHLAFLSRADLEPNVVGLDDLALFFLYTFNHKGDTDQPISIVHLGKGKRVILIIYKNQLDFIRILPGDPDDVEPLKECLKLYQLKNRPMPLSEILLTGHSAGDGDMAGNLTELTKIGSSGKSVGEFRFGEFAHRQK